MTSSMGDRIRLGLKIAGTLVVLAVAYVWIVRPLLASDEEKIAAIVENVVDGARRRHVGDMLESVAGDYRDPINSSRDDLLQKLRYGALAYHKWLVDLIEEPRIVVDAENGKATVTLRASVRWGRDLKDEPTHDAVATWRGTDVYRVHFAKREGRWWIISTDGGT